MSEFFKPPPVPPRPPRAERFPFQRPFGFVGAVAPISFVLTRRDEVAVAVSEVIVFPNGFEFTVWLLHRDQFPIGLVQTQMRMGMGLDTGDVPPQFLRIGLKFADGASVTNLGGLAGTLRGVNDPERHERILMPAGGGGGTDSEMRQRYWSWPLPTPGPLNFVCEWPHYDIR